MSGIVGSITACSKEINDLGMDNTIKGMKEASYLEGKIREAELNKHTEELKQEPVEEVDAVRIVKEIQDDMVR